MFIRWCGCLWGMYSVLRPPRPVERQLELVAFSVVGGIWTCSCLGKVAIAGIRIRTVPSMAQEEG